MDDVHVHLIKNHPLIQTHIEVAGPTVSLLLLAHCSFPFPAEVPFTTDALIRALGLLTHKSNTLFARNTSNDSLSYSPKDRMEFVFSALARPEPATGVPTIKDVVATLCRVPYPKRPHRTFHQTHTATSVRPMAERLLPSSTNFPLRTDLRLSISSLRPLADLCNALLNDNGVEAEGILEGKESLDQREFIQWAQAVGTPCACPIMR